VAALTGGRLAVHLINRKNAPVLFSTRLGTPPAMLREDYCLLLADCMAEPVGHELPRRNHDASRLVAQLLFGWVSGSAELVTALERRLVAGTR
jgi:hypothetical protein